MKSDERTAAERAEKNDFEIVEGELLEVSSGKEIEFFDEEKAIAGASRQRPKTKTQKPPENFSAAQRNYLLLPVVFLAVALLGGLRFADPGGAFLFLKPALVCLVFGAVTLILFFRAGLLELEGWFSEDFSTLKNAVNAAVLLALFAASVQIYNSLVPERGLPFWVVAFCFFWTLWNNLFADFEARKMLRSLGALFGLAFVVKYLVLANLTAPAADNWLQGLWNNPAQEAFTRLLDLPRFSAATGYAQFFTLAFYLLGLYLLPRRTAARSN